MSLFNPERFRLTVQPDRMQLETRTGRKPWQVIGDSPYSQLTTSSNLTPRLQQLLSTHLPRGRKLFIVVSDQVARYFMVNPPKKVGSFKDLKTIAELRFSTLFGSKSSEWIMQADWAIDRPFIACALPRDRVDSILRVLKAGNWFSQGMVPESIAIWNAQSSSLRDHSAWFARITDQHTLFAACVDGRIQQVSTWKGETLTSAEQLKPILMREALRWDCSLPGTLYLNSNASSHMLNWNGKRIGETNLVTLNIESHGMGSFS
ncbi:hypothetical protein AAKU58_004132 [Oxalobacteraceae bacterium GrIS 1.18]